MLASKYRMTAVQAEAAQRQVEQRAAQDGLEFRMDGLRSGTSSPNGNSAFSSLGITRPIRHSQDLPCLLQCQQRERVGSGPAAAGKQVLGVGQQPPGVLGRHDRELAEDRCVR